MKKTFVNVYKDADGRFLDDTEYNSYEAAYANRADASTYLETVQIVRFEKELRDLLIAYENFKLMTSEKFSVSEQAIDAFLESNF